MIASSRLRLPSAVLLVAFLLLQHGTEGRRRSQLITSEHGAIATDDGRCSIVGRDVMIEGGNAVDAAVATALCLGVVSYASSGIGGGAFMVIRMADGKVQAFDMREVAPYAASKDMYNGNATLKANGALSIGVPGELAGLYEAWKQHGRLPWQRLVRPAIHFAETGFRISPYLYMEMSILAQGIFSDPGLRSVFTKNGALLNQGDLCQNKRLAETLRAISINGPQIFYNGSVGTKLVEDIQKIGGIITMKDLEDYRVREREPISADVMGYNILSMPPPSSGGVGMILILNILAQYGIPMGVSGSLGLHRFVESLKHLIAIRMKLGDPDFVNITEVVSDMLSPKFAEELKKTINDSRTFGPLHYGEKLNILKDHGTTHLSVIDNERNAVALTSTINYHFGSQFVSPSTGILLNNEMDDFSMPGINASSTVPPPSPANFVHPKKRPLSSMMPTIILKDGQLKAVMGSSGGLRIIAGTTQVFLNHFVKGMDPLSSILSPRIFHSLIPNVVEFENYTDVLGDHFEVPLNLREALKRKGHHLLSLAENNNCQVVVHNSEYDIKNGGGVAFGDLTAVSDPRKGGFPEGF